MMNADKAESEDPQEFSSSQSLSNEEARYRKIRKDLKDESPSSKLNIFRRMLKFISFKKSIHETIKDELEETIKPPKKLRQGKSIRWGKITQWVTIFCLIVGSLLIGSGLVLLVFSILLVFSLYQAFSPSNAKVDNQKTLNQKTPNWLSEGKCAEIFNVLSNPWRRTLILFFAIVIVAVHLVSTYYFEKYFTSAPGQVDSLTGIIYAVDFPKYVDPESEEIFYVTLTNPMTDTKKEVSVTLKFSNNAQISPTGKNSSTVLEFGDLTHHDKTRKGVSFRIEKVVRDVVSVQLYLTTQDSPIHRVQSTYEFGIAPRYSKRAVQKVLGLLSVVIAIAVGALKESLQLSG
jgi:hypothetical protein